MLEPAPGWRCPSRFSTSSLPKWHPIAIFVRKIAHSALRRAVVEAFSQFGFANYGTEPRFSCAGVTKIEIECRFRTPRMFAVNSGDTFSGGLLLLSCQAHEWPQGSLAARGAAHLRWALRRRSHRALRLQRTFCCGCPGGKLAQMPGRGLCTSARMGSPGRRWRRTSASSAPRGCAQAPGMAPPCGHRGVRGAGANARYRF